MKKKEESTKICQIKYVRIHYEQFMVFNKMFLILSVFKTFDILDVLI